MITLLAAASPAHNPQCLRTTIAPCIELYDCIDCAPEAKRTYRRTVENEPVHFTVWNPEEVGLCFAAVVDNCLLGAADMARRDFLIGNRAKLCFVEIKTSKMNQRSAARQYAAMQLESCIDYVKTLVDLSETIVMAIICLRAKQSYPVRSATSINAAVKFKEQHNALLSEGQQIIF